MPRSKDVLRATDRTGGCRGSDEQPFENVRIRSMTDLFDTRDFTVRRLAESMRYGPNQFREDWETVIALSQLMAIHGPFECQQYQMEDAMNRVLAYLANNPDSLPWEEQ